MFSDTLKTIRVSKNLTIAQLAMLSSTSRAAISQYESGRKIPRIDTASRILEALEQVHIEVAPRRRMTSRLDVDVLAPLRAITPDRDREVTRAREDLAVIVDADANAEHLDVTWGQVKTVVNGTTVSGEALSVWRLNELNKSATAALRTIECGIEPRLQIISRDGNIADNDQLDPPRRALDFLTRATQHGADPAYTRHLAGSFLAHHGYPWMWVPNRLDSDYRRALVVCMRFGDGNPLARVLISSTETMDM
jgi:transcriptional regulator with XRE-family HTH domain